MNPSKVIKELDKKFLSLSDQSESIDWLAEKTCQLVADALELDSCWIVLFDGHQRVKIASQQGCGAAFGPFTERLRLGHKPLCIKMLDGDQQDGQVIDRNKTCAACELATAQEHQDAFIFRIPAPSFLQGYLYAALNSVNSDDHSWKRRALQTMAERFSQALGPQQHHASSSHDDNLINQAGFQFLAQNSDSAVQVIDAKGNIRFSNSRACQLTGYTCEELKQCSFLTLCPAPEMTTWLRTALKNGRASFVIDIISKSGQTLETEIKATKIPQSSDLLLLTIKNVAEETAHQRELSQLYQKYNAIFNESDVAIFVKDLNGAFIEVNEAFASYYGRPAKELIGLTDYDLLPKKDANKLAQFDRQTIQRGSALRLSLTHKIQGKQVSTWTTKIPLRNEQNEIIGILGIIHNVTAKVLAEIALKESEEKFRKAFHTSPDPISINRLRDGLFVTINTSFEKMTGYTPDEVMGKTAAEIDIWGTAEDQKKFVEELIRNKRVENFKATFHCKDGTIANGLISASLFRLNGELCILSISRRIDEIINAQKALQDSLQRFHTLFQDSPVPVWEMDMSSLAMLANKLRKKKIRDLPAYLKSHTKMFNESVAGIKVINVNSSVLELFGASDITQFKEQFRHHIQELCRHILLELWHGDTKLSFETSLTTFDNSQKEVAVKCMPIPGHEQDWSRMILATIDVSESKNYVRQLARTQAVLHETQRIGRVGSWQKPIDSDDLWWSEGAYLIFGYNPDDETPPLEIYAHALHPEDRKRVFLAQKQAESSRTPYSLVYKITDKTGTEKYIKEFGETHYDAKGRALWTAGTVQDITEIKQAERKLKLAITQYQNLVEQSNDAIYLLYDNKFESVNAKFEELFGYTLEECNTEDFHFMDLVAEESKPIIKERMRKFAAGENIEPVYEFSAISKDGRTIKCEASVSHFKYKDGIATQGIIRDIGARKKAEEESRKLLYAVEQSPAAVLITDLKGRIEYANPQYLEMTGYELDELKGETPFIFQTDTEDSQAIIDLLADGKVWKGEIQNIRKDGQAYWEQIKLCPIFNNNGLITHYLYLGEDVTERRELEDQLRQSQKMEAIGRLAGGVAHDFNNLLTIINGYSEMLLSTIEKNNPLFNGLHQIKQAGVRAESLTRQLLAFSRKQIMQPKIIDLNELVQNMEKMLGRLIGEDISLVTLFEPDVAKVKVDPGQCEQVILNLAINSRDAMPLGGSLTIRTKNMVLQEGNPLLQEGNTPGPYVMLSVTDTGHGMDEETLQRIFEPFYSTKELGTGLGLATVYGIVKQSGGITAVKSKPGRGTTFTIYFPAIQRSAENIADNDGADVTTKYQGTIMVAEDEDSLRDLAILALSRVGFSTLAAANGPEAIERCKAYNGKIDLLLTDVIMPQMSGRQLADILTEWDPSIKVLYMSGYTDDSIVQHGVLEEGTHFIQKPFTPDRLIRKIKELLEL